MNYRAGTPEPGRHGTASTRMPVENAMTTMEKPKVLPWLAHRAGMPEHVVHGLWKKALASAGVDGTQSGKAHRQATAMHHLLLMLNRASDAQGSRVAKAGPAAGAACY